MNYKDIQTIIRYKKIKQIIYNSQKLIISMKESKIFTQEQYNFYKTLINKYKKEEIKLEIEIEKKRLLENITIDDLIAIEIFDK